MWRDMAIEAGTLIFKIIDGKNYETQHFINGYRYRVEKVFRMGQNWWSATYLWENASDQTNWKELQHLFPTRKAALAACRAHNKKPRIKYKFRGRDNKGNLTFKEHERSMITWVVDPRWTLKEGFQVK
jgi:hypothetical protein